MKSLISVTPKEFKRNFSKIMDACADTCIETGREIVVAIPEKVNSQIYAHIEIAKIAPRGKNGVEYKYNSELIEKYGIDISNSKAVKIEAIIIKAFEEKIYNAVSPEVKYKLAGAAKIVAEELAKIM